MADHGEDLASEVQRRQMTGSEERDVYLALMGKTGSGKSATGNALLGEEKFKTSCYAEAETCETTERSSEFEGVRYHVIDTPGLCDTRGSQFSSKKTIIKHFFECMLIREETGIDCFLYVLNYASPRLTQEEVDTFETLKDVFGEKMFKKYCIIIFTRGELFKGSIEEWIKGDQQSAKFKEIVQLCSNRVLMFNNEGDIMQKKKQRKDLLEMIDKIQNEEKYTNKNFEEAFQNRKKILETEGFKNIYTRVRDEVNNIRTAVDSLQLNPEADGFKDSLNNLDKEKTKLKSLYAEVKNEMGENITNVFDPLINQLKDGMDKIYMANFILLQHEYDQYKGSKLTDKEKIAVLSRQANALEIKAGVLQQDMNMFPSSLKTAELVNGMVSKIKDLRLQLSTSSKILNDLHDIFKGVGDARKKK